MIGSRELRKEWARPIPRSSEEDRLKEALCFFFVCVCEENGRGGDIEGAKDEGKRTEGPG